MTESETQRDDVPTKPARKRRDDIIDLRFLFIFWLKWSWLVIPLAAAGAYQGYRDLQSFQPQYVAKMTILPTGGGGGQQVQGSRAVSTVLSGLGLSLSSGNSGTIDRLSIVLQSIALARRLDEKHGFMLLVFGSSWDAEKGAWIRPSGEEFEKQERRSRFFRRNAWTEPNLERLAKYVGGSLKVKPSRLTSFYEVSVSHSDPEFALYLLKTIYDEADDLLREQDRLESEKRREYIDTQLERETKRITVDALLGLKANEERTRMLLESELPYVARILDPAYVSSTATEPNVRRFFALPMIGGVVLGFALLTLVALFRRE